MSKWTHEILDFGTGSTGIVWLKGVPLDPQANERGVGLGSDANN